MKIEKAFLPGSFDPLTNGHLELLSCALKLSNKVCLAIGCDSNKASFFSFQERINMAKAVVSDSLPRYINNVDVISFKGLMVDAARAACASVVFRGVRDHIDFDYEMRLAGMNRSLAPDIQTVFSPASSNCSMISATLVRQVFMAGGDVSSFVPPIVVAALKRKLSSLSIEDTL